jgi:hypothetical protein
MKNSRKVLLLKQVVRTLKQTGVVSPAVKRLAAVAKKIEDSNLTSSEAKAGNRLTRFVDNGSEGGTLSKD